MDFNGLLIIFVTTIMVVVLTLEVSGFFKLIYGLKWFILLILLFNLLLTSWKIEYLNLLTIMMKFLIIIIAFAVFNRTTSPDQVVDSLIKLKLPPTLAWTIGAALRQSIFIIDELTYIREIQRARNGYYGFKKTQKLKAIINEIYQLLISIYARALIITGPYADTLINRGWTGAHSTITLYTSKFEKSDVIFLLITIIIPILLKLILSSQIFIP